MLGDTPQGGLKRRSFIGSALALSGAAGTGLLPFAAGAAQAQQSPVWAAPVPDMRFRFACSNAAWNNNIEKAIEATSRLGLPGLEPFRHDVANYLDKPLILKKMFDDAGVSMVTCSNGGGPDFSGNFYDAAKTTQTVADHIKFARDFIRLFGYCDHFKMNMGGRPPGGETTDEHIKIAADALNRIGKETIGFGIRLAPHPHVGSLIETEHEVRTLMALTDPRYVWIVTDTSHLTLGGMDPFQIIRDYWPRVAEVHYKDAPRHLRGNKVLAVPKSGPEAGGHGWFRNLGGKDSGGVDFPAIQKWLIDHKYNGWITLDIDESMLEGKDMEETLKINLNYLVNVLHVSRNML